ncbi:peptidylprolyl isomerase [Prolixibacteraceae bacterium JC049]|nr:peptidylprolyl isomerase [Prolixibacteraceae bacterium JC049]
MKLVKYLLSVLAVVIMIGCSKFKSQQQLVKIETPYGDIKVKLYNETPLHRDNFVKLTKDGYFDDLLFHRVIHNFMIQGGDPDSKDAPAEKRLGNGGPGYTIPAEITPKLIHKKGVLAAARLGDSVNPDRKSSGSQFYLVQGKVFSQGALDTLEMRFNSKKREKIRRELMLEAQTEMIKLQKEGKADAATNLMIEVEEKADKAFEGTEKFKFTEEQRKVYSTVGGTPHLDGAYTVFGEIVEGLDIVDKIAEVETDSYDRPTKDVTMKIELIEE